MSFLPGPKRRKLSEVLKEKLGETVFGFFPFLRESRPKFSGLEAFDAVPPELPEFIRHPVAFLLITTGPRPECFLVDEDFESLRFITEELSKCD